MTRWGSFLNDDPTEWLLEESNPSVRYFTLRWLLDRPETDEQVSAASHAIAESHPVCRLIQALKPAGYWGSVADGHRGTKGPLMLLLWLGYRADDRVKRAVEYRVRSCLSKDGGYGITIKGKTVLVPCHGAELLREMLWFGYEHDGRTRKLLDWLVAVQSRDGVWKCLGKKTSPPCQWAAADVLRALADLPTSWFDQRVKQAQQRGVDYFLNASLYHFRHKPETGWLQFGYPLQWDSDVLDVLELVAPFVSVDDPRVADGLERLLSKQDKEGRWPCEKQPKGGKWIENYIPLEQVGRPSKWVTLHAIKTLKMLCSPKRETLS